LGQLIAPAVLTFTSCSEDFAQTAKFRCVEVHPPLVL